MHDHEIGNCVKIDHIYIYYISNQYFLPVSKLSCHHCRERLSSSDDEVFNSSENLAIKI